MRIRYPTKIAWRRYIEDNTAFLSSTSKQKEFENFLKKLGASQILHTYIEPDESFYTWFNGLYTKMLSSKENALEFDIVNYEIKERGVSMPKKALVLEERRKKVGATIFFECTSSINIAFKAYETHWPVQPSLRIGPSLYSEYLLFLRAKELGKKYVSLGVDRNPYGPNADIGLATYKFSAHYIPKHTNKGSIEEMETNDIDRDTLIFHSAAEDTGHITEATLAAKDFAPYEMLLKKSGTVKINQIPIK